MITLVVSAFDQLNSANAIHYLNGKASFEQYCILTEPGADQGLGSPTVLLLNHTNTRDRCFFCAAYRK